MSVYYRQQTQSANLPVLFLLTSRLLGATRYTDNVKFGAANIPLNLHAKFHLDRFMGVGLRLQIRKIEFYQYNCP